MQILSHRGYWHDFLSESNKRIAFERSFDLGFGTETDLRDICGEIVISHDMPKGDEMTFEELLEIMGRRNLPLALNKIGQRCVLLIERMLPAVFLVALNDNARFRLHKEDAVFLFHAVKLRKRGKETVKRNTAAHVGYKRNLFVLRLRCKAEPYKLRNQCRRQIIHAVKTAVF